MAGGKRSQESMNEMIKNEQSNKMKEALDQLIKQVDSNIEIILYY